MQRLEQEVSELTAKLKQYQTGGVSPKILHSNNNNSAEQVSESNSEISDSDLLILELDENINQYVHSIAFIYIYHPLHHLVIEMDNRYSRPLLIYIYPSSLETD